LQFFGVRAHSHHPEVRVAGSTIAEHVDDNPSDRDVAVVDYPPGTVRSGQWGNEEEMSPRGWLRAVQ
jgi:hypothetical protein